MKTWNDYAKDYNQKVWETGDLDHTETLNPVVFKLLWDVKDKKVLDLGCGQWYFSRLLTKQWASVTGIDISEYLNYTYIQKISLILSILLKPYLQRR